MKLLARNTVVTLAITTAAALAPSATAAEPTAGRIAVTPYAAGIVGDTFECGGTLGKLWCK